MWSCPLTLSLSPTQCGSACTPTPEWWCALALPECTHVLQNGLHLQETPEIAILDHAIPVDQERPGGRLPLPWHVASPLAQTPATPPEQPVDARSQTPGGEVDAEAVGVGVQDCRGIDVRLGRHGEEDLLPLCREALL